MPNKIDISLIIPAYNESQYIGTCLEYALKNSNGLLKEIIVIDNASTDATAQIAASFSGVKVVREDNKGLIFARQRGWLSAQGDILAYIDADTRMPQGWCETVRNEFLNESKLVCLSGPYEYYDLPAWQQLGVKLYWLVLAKPIYFFTKYMAVGGNFAISRKALEQMKGFNTKINFYGEDTDIARRASKFGVVKFKFDFIMPTSGRRLSKQGIFKTAWIYILNFGAEVVFKKPATKKYSDIR